MSNSSESLLIIHSDFREYLYDLDRTTSAISSNNMMQGLAILAFSNIFLILVSIQILEKKSPFLTVIKEIPYFPAMASANWVLPHLSGP